jgi:C-terminal processing protease CtpA/Prc
LTNFYLRENNETKQFWTSSHVDGDRYIEHKPVFIITSQKTFSAAEEFAYNLQVLKRAIIIGETTAGGANPASLYSMSSHLSVLIPDGTSLNAITNSNWEATGVSPDIEVKNEYAFETAYKKALLHVTELYKDVPEYQFLSEAANEELEKLSTRKQPC